MHNLLSKFRIIERILTVRLTPIDYYVPGL